MKVAFDCDGTLIDFVGNPRPEMCKLLFAFVNSEANVIVWSGGGKDYAARIYDKVKAIYGKDILDGLVEIRGKDFLSGVDLTFDDQPMTLGKVNVTLPPGSL